MKEITYTEFNDYIEKSRAFDDPKVVKVYTLWDTGEFGATRMCKAITFLRTWLLQWKGITSNEIIESLTESGHRKGKIIDVVPMGRVQ